MGIQLVEEVMDYASRLGLSAAERWGLVVLARDAGSDRVTFHHATHPELLLRAAISPDAWRHIRTALVRKRVLQVVVQGRRNRGAYYAIPPLGSICAADDVHPADAEGQMADPYGPESRTDAGPIRSAIERPMPDPYGPVSRPMPDPYGPPSKIAPISPSSVPPPPMAGAVPTARQPGAERQIREEEVAAANFERYHQRERAFAIMESLKRLPVSRDSGRRGMELCVAIGERLAIGRPEQEIRDCLDAPLVTSEPVYDPIGFLLKRIRRIPVVPPGNVGVRDSGRGIEELQGKLAQEGVELYARQGDRPGVVDTAKIPGGWRSYRVQPEASDGA